MAHTILSHFLMTTVKHFNGLSKLRIKFLKSSKDSKEWPKLSQVKSQKYFDLTMVENIPLWSFNSIAHTMVSCINGRNHTFFKVMTQLNAFIYERMRCFLHQSHMLNNLWLEAIKIACYLLNCHITKSFKNLIPQEKFIGRKQDVFHFHTFGT